LTRAQFKKFSANHCSPKEKDVFPDLNNPDYRYDPKPMVELPPIDEIEFYHLFYSGCSSFSLGEELRLLPKKQSDLDEKSDTPEYFWGIRACEKVAFRWVACYVCLCILPSAVFFIVASLNLTSSFDLQNPSTPLQLTIALLATFWTVFYPSLQQGGGPVYVGYPVERRSTTVL
jgi:hypothetical protein